MGYFSHYFFTGRKDGYERGSVIFGHGLLESLYRIPSTSRCGLRRPKERKLFPEKGEEWLWLLPPEYAKYQRQK